MKFDLDSILATLGSQMSVGLLLGNWVAGRRTGMRVADSPLAHAGKVPLDRKVRSGAKSKHANLQALPQRMEHSKHT